MTHIFPMKCDTVFCLKIFSDSVEEYKGMIGLVTLFFGGLFFVCMCVCEIIKITSDHFE